MPFEGEGEFRDAVALSINRLSEIISDEDKTKMPENALAGIVMALTEGKFLMIVRSDEGYVIEVSSDKRLDELS